MANRSLTDRALGLLHRLGLFALSISLQPRKLTVFCYHRITDPGEPGFDTFKPNVSATPEGFAAQIDWLQRHYHILSLGELEAWLHGGAELPRHAALITFDDGYRDNYEHAFPVLKAHGLPAVIFLATDYIANRQPFFWDLAAYCFTHTARSSAELPHLGHVLWANSGERDEVLARWLEVLKRLPDAEKWDAVHALPELLEVEVSEDTFVGLMLSWDQVREMLVDGVAMGAHTMSHPILTRVPLEQARAELAGSKHHIEKETGVSVTALAYPNGGPQDYSPEIMQVAAESGLRTAFILDPPGPATWGETRAAPRAVRRIFIGHRDTLARFAAKASGFLRLIRRG